MMQTKETTFQKYPAYKDSGVEWLGVIPEHWEVKRIKHLYKIGRGRVIAQTELDDNGEYPVYSSQTKDNGVLGYINTFDFDCEQITWTTDGANAGTIFIRTGRHNCTNVCGTLQPTNVFLSNNFNKYALEVSSPHYKRPDTNGAKIMNNEMAEIFIVNPPLTEQTAIATFLDDKTAKIDRAIAQKEQLIALLKERKQIVIQDAVTGQLKMENGEWKIENGEWKIENGELKMDNSQLSTVNYPLKDSGVEWIGEIPVGWEVKRLRNIGTTQNGVSAGAEYFGAGFPFVSYGDVYKNTELPLEVKGLAKSTDEDRINYSVIEGDVFFTRTSETIEEIGFSSTCLKTINNATFAGFLIRFRPRSGFLEPTFSKYYFSSKIHRAFFVKEINLVIRASLSQELLKNLPVLLPPIAEQRLIASHIETQSAKIDRAIALQQTQIEKLKEYKVSLIDSAVTGKIKVSEL